MEKEKLKNLVKKIEEQGSIFKDKSHLDTLSYSSDIIGREKQYEELARYLVGYKKGS